jgi:hypothetical protein
MENSQEASIIEKISLAFSTTPRPDDENLVTADSNHLRECDDCREAKHFFKGKTRQDILSDERNYPHLVNAFDFFTPQAWYYFLPAFLIQGLIRQRYNYNHFWHHDQAELIKRYWSQRIELLDCKQTQAVLDYLECCKKGANEDGLIERFGKIVEWWQSIYQQKQLTNSIQT